METKRDHRDEHPGCRAIAPWLPACNRYRLNVNLIAAATADVSNMAEADREYWKDFLKTWAGRRSKWDLRSRYISHRENWHASEWRENLANVRSFAKALGDEYLIGRTVEQVAEDEWKLKVQRLVLEVLYVHKAPLPPYVQAL